MTSVLNQEVGWNFVNTSSRVLMNFGVYHYRAERNVTLLRIENEFCIAKRSIACSVLLPLMEMYVDKLSVSSFEHQ